MKMLFTLIARVAAVFGSSALAAVAGGAVMGVELWKSAAIAGFVAASGVSQKLLAAWADDGVLTRDEIAVAFGRKPIDDDEVDGEQ